MSDSYSCETKLREIAEKLHREAYELEQAADALLAIRESNDHSTELANAKKWAAEWLKR